MATNPRQRKVIAVDWDTRTLRIVHAQVKKRAVTVDRVLSVAIPVSVDVADAEQMGAHIRQALEQEGIATRRVIVDIPRDQVILNTLTLPTGLPDELPGMVQIQIAKELPFPVSDAVIDFAVAPHESDAKTAEVLVAAARREVLDQYVAILGAAGLRLDRIGLRPYANTVAVNALLRHAMPECVAFIDIRPLLTEIDILRHSTLVFSRAASVMIPDHLPDRSYFSLEHREGGQDDTDASSTGRSLDIDDTVPRTKADVVEALVVEVTRSIEAFRAADTGSRVDHIVIGGDHGLEEPLADALQERLGVTTEMYNPASTFGWEPDEGAAAAAYAATLGLVLGQVEDASLQFDFLHPKKMESSTKRHLRRAPAIAAVVLLFITAAGLVMANATKTDRLRLADIKRQIKELEEDERLKKSFVEFVNLVEVFDEWQYIWVDDFLDVVSVLPSHEELVLTRVDFRHSDGLIVLKTKSKERDTTAELVERLHAFRRKDREKPRFNVVRGPVSVRSRDLYPFVEELKVRILKDASRSRSG